MLLQVSDPLLAVDVDMAIATRAREEMRRRLQEQQDHVPTNERGEADGLSVFFMAVLTLLGE